MEVRLTTHTQGQTSMNFDPNTFQSLTVMLPGKQIIIDMLSGAIRQELADDETLFKTADIVAQFQEHQKKRGLSQSTIASYRSVLVALAASAPEWPPTPKEIDVLFDSYHAKKRSGVTIAEYWVRLSTWFKWAYRDKNPDDTLEA